MNSDNNNKENELKLEKKDDDPIQKSPDEVFSVVGKYPKLPGGGGSAGTDFQIKLLLYCLLKGYKCNEVFRLSTENQRAGNLDDVVYETENCRFFIQAKHKGNNGNELGFNELFPKQNHQPNRNTNNENEEKVKGDFNIYKYLNSFHNIKNGDKVSALILCTNLKLDSRKLDTALKAEMEKIGITTDSTNYITTNNDISENHIFKQIEDITCLSFNENKVGQFIKKNSIAKLISNKIDQFVKKLQIISIGDTVLDNHIKAVSKQIQLFDKNIPEDFAFPFLCEKIKLWFQSKDALFLNRQSAIGYICCMRSQSYIKSVKNDIPISFKKEKEEIEQYTKMFIEDKTFYKVALIKILKELHSEESKILFLNPEDPWTIQSQFLEAFELPEYVSLIIPILVSTEKIINAILNLTKTIEARKYKKIIIITFNNNKFATKLANKFKKTMNCVLTFSELSVESQMKILEKDITFQDKKMSIRNIYEPYQDKMNGVILLEFLSKKNVCINEKCSNEENLRRFYIKRNIRISNKKNSKNVNLFSSFDKDVRSKSDIISEINFCQLILEEDKQKSKSNKFILLSDIPGMGKSALLSNMELTIRKTCYWVIKLNLRYCTQILFNALQENMESVDIQKLLPKINSTHQNIFELPDKVILLIDSLEEIAPDYTNIVLNTLINISRSSNIKKIIMATRPHVLQRIVDATNPVVYEVDPFTSENSQTFILNYWKSKLNLDHQQDKAKLYIQHLFKSLKHNVGFNKTESLIGIPLQTKMIAEIFVTGYKDENTEWLGCEEYLKNDEMLFPKIITMSKLYDMFIVRKREVYIYEQSNAQGNINTIKQSWKTFDEALKTHTTEALKLLFAEKHHNHFELLETKPNIDMDTLLKMGIIVKSEEHVEFIHQTFAEYFAAKYFCILIEESNNLSSDLIKFLINNIILMFRKRGTIVLFMEHSLRLDQVREDVFDRFALMTELTSNQVELEVLAAQGYFNLLTLLIKKYRHPKELLFPILNDNTFLHLAVKHNAIDFAKLLVEKGHEVNEKKSNGQIPLHIAFNNDNKEMIDFLLQKGSNIFVKDFNDNTLLHYAARTNNTNMARYLIKQHDITVYNSRGETPLHHAIANRCNEMFQFLLEKNHLIDVKDDRGDSLLHYAAKSGDCYMADSLIRKGDEIYFKNLDGQYPLHFSIKYRKKDMSEYLLEKYENVNNVKDKDGNTLLHYTAQFNQTEIADILISKGHEVNVFNHRGQTPIHFAFIRKNKVMIYLLLKNDHKTNVLLPDGNSLLHAAAKLNDSYLAKVLVNAKHPINVQNSRQETPLHIAISLGNKQMINFLSTKNYDNTSQDKDGNTLLHIAARKGDIETAKILMEQGHEINVINDRQETPLHLAIACRCSELCTLLLKKGHISNIRDEQLNTVIHLAAKLNDVKLAEEYNKHVHDLNVVNNTNKTPLFLAIINQHEEMTNFLLNNGHRVNIRDSNGNTLLHFAAKNNNTQIASLLIEKLRQINVQNEYGFTPLHFAVFYKCEEMSKFLLENDHSILDEDYERNRILHIAAKMDEIETAKLLVEKNHELNVKNRYGETPLYVAVFNNSKAVTEYLLAVDDNLDINDKYTDVDNTLLHVAVESNNVKLVNLLKQKGHAINIKNAKEQTPIHVAIANKYRNILESLITKENNFEISNEDTLLHCAAENNAFQIADLLPIHKINEKDSNGHTALHLAIKNHSKQMFDFLIEKGAKITYTDNDGNTLLHCAAFNTNLEAAIVLVKKNHSINVRNLNGETPLHCLITRSVEIDNRFRQIDIIILLLDHDHTIDVKDKYGNTLLHFAAKFNGTELANILINKKKHKLHVQNDNGQTPLHVAIANSSIETTKLLLNVGENISTTDKDGNTLLHYAAKAIDIQTLTLLIFKGYDVNAGNRFKQTLVDFLVQRFNYKILIYLLRHGVNPNTKLLNGNTLLHLAAEKNNTDLADLLLNRGLSVNVTNPKKQTPLHISIKNKSINMSKLLLNERHHMEVKDVKDEFGNTLLHYAAKEDDVEIADLLLDKQHGIDVENLKKESPLHFAIESKAKRMIQLLLDRGHSIEAKDINKNTLLHLAAKSNNTDLALLLIEKGHEVNVLNNYNETPLFWSVSRKFKEMTKLLLGNEHATYYCVFGNTLLHTAVANDDVEIAKLLIENGLNVDVQNAEGETPFQFAIKHKRKDITNFLFNQDNNRTINAEIAVSLVKSINHIKSNIRFSISRDIMILRYNRMSKLLLENESTIIVKDENENTLLHLVSEANDTEVGDLLILRGHNINIKNAFEMTPLYVASINNSREMCRLLLEQDQIDIHCLPDDDKDSLLHLAVEQNDLRRVDLLLKRNHDVNGKNSNEETPLLIASKKKFINIIKRLLQHDRIEFESIKDKEGYTLLHFAAEVDNTELADLLLTKGQTTNIKNVYNDTPLHIALRFEFENMVKRLVLSHTADFNDILDKKGNTLLHFAVDRNNFELVDLLIQKDHDIYVMNGNHETPVHIAFNKKYISILKLLLKNTGVDFKNIVDTTNISLLDFAADDIELKDILMKNQFPSVSDQV